MSCFSTGTGFHTRLGPKNPTKSTLDDRTDENPWTIEPTLGTTKRADPCPLYQDPGKVLRLHVGPNPGDL